MTMLQEIERSNVLYCMFTIRTQCRNIADVRKIGEIIIWNECVCVKVFEMDFKFVLSLSPVEPMGSTMISNIPYLIVLVQYHWAQLEFFLMSFVHGQQSANETNTYNITSIFVHFLSIFPFLWEYFSFILLLNVWLLPGFPIPSGVNFVLVALVSCPHSAAIQLTYQYLLHI